jgi:cell division protein FtsL
MPDQITSTTPNTPPVAPAMPTPATNAVNSMPPATGGSSKGMLLVIVAAFLVVAVLVGVGIYTYMTMRETNPAFHQVSENIQQSLDSAANDISGITDTDVNADFSEVDKELNQL